MGNRPKIENRLRKIRLYQERATRVRDLASQERDNDLRKAMLKLAEEYDEYCQTLLDSVEPTHAIAYHEHTN